MANIPSFIHEPFVGKDGVITDSWQLAITQLFGQLQQGISDEAGYQVPTKTADQLSGLVNNVPDGTHFYDMTNNTPVVKKNGTFVAYP